MRGGEGSAAPPGEKLHTRVSPSSRGCSKTYSLFGGDRMGCGGAAAAVGSPPASLSILTRKYMRYAYICAPAPEARSARPQRGG